MRLIFNSENISSARSIRMKFKKQNQNGGTCIVHGCRSFEFSYNFTDKASSNSSEVDKTTVTNYAILAAMLPKESYSVRKVRSGHSSWIVQTDGEIFISVAVIRPARLLT